MSIVEESRRITDDWNARERQEKQTEIDSIWRAILQIVLRPEPKASDANELAQLRHNLGYATRQEPFDSLTFEYDAVRDLGLKEEDIAHIREIHQLRPFVTGQPWGIKISAARTPQDRRTWAFVVAGRIDDVVLAEVYGIQVINRRTGGFSK